MMTNFMLEFFDHENLCNIIDVDLPEHPTGYEDIYIITDLMETDLHRVIYSKQELSDKHI
jgi:mitogen-activated protein kinase 1/3